MKKIFLLPLLVAASVLAQADEDRPNRGLVAEAGAGLSMNGGEGNGVGAAFYPLPRLSLNAGAGFSLAGFKYGAGARFLFGADEPFSPLIGIDAAAFTGAKKFTLTDPDNQSAAYRVSGGATIAPLLGFRYGYARFVNLSLCAGYAFPVAGGQAHYVSGSAAGGIRRVAGYYEQDGPVLSLALNWRFYK